MYDSENTANDGYQKIDSLQRILSSLNLKVKTVSQNDYYKGLLNKKYIGVISLINWPQVGLTNKSFLQDRQKFRGIKLHIGDNLTVSEAKELGGSATKIYQQQLILNFQGNKQLLPFSETATVLSHLSKGTRKIGLLTSQQKNQSKYTYGVIYKKVGFLPYFKKSGVSLMAAVKTIAELFGSKGNYRPLLAITGVSPYSNLKVLDEISNYCYQKNIPFSISTVTVSENTEMKAYRHFTKVLKKVEERNGIIFLNTPAVGGAGTNSAAELNERMTASFVAFANHQVYPVGISSQGYWNQDEVLRKQALMQADHWLLLPSETPTFVKQDNNANVAHQSLYAVSASSLLTAQQKSGLKFEIPTAITYKLPDSSKKLFDFKRLVQSLHVTWFDPVLQNWQTKVSSNTTTIEYKGGNYFLNGQRKELSSKASGSLRTSPQNKFRPLFTRFFSLQGNILMLFFAIALSILLVFIGLGRRIYLQMFKR
ncbi:hypothetical protein ACLJJ6_00235 [Pediococcus siamensis]|uniref:hypothetical protein n=1 Tax=Pediococcus siamensis TaxID=381829 RepID=UPI0039A1C235